jgi:hypothetical protein
MAGIWLYSDEVIALGLLVCTHFSGWLLGGGAVGLIAWRRRKALPALPPAAIARKHAA